MNHPQLITLHEKLATHSLYSQIKTIVDLQIFMETHVFAVWDFMSLLKRLQREMTCVELPWRPSAYPKEMVRLINEIVLGEESDHDHDGAACDHFTMYLKAMKDIEANPTRLLSFVHDLNDDHCTQAESQFVKFNLDLAMNGKIHEVASAFFFGREKLIPDMFTAILGDLSINFNERDSFPHLRYYLERHVEVDGGEHSHKAQDCLQFLCATDEKKWTEAFRAGEESLILRSALWDEVEKKIVSKKSH